MLDFDNLSRTLSAVLKAAKNLNKSKSSKDRIKKLAAIREGLGKLTDPAFNEALDAQEKKAKEALQSALAQRREKIGEGARDRRMPYQRLDKQDKIDIFSLNYVDEKVIIHIGNTYHSELIEDDGAKVVEHLENLRRELESSHLPRERFFKCLRAAIAMATADGLATEGKVPVRELFPYVAIRRQLESEKFRKRPDALSFKDYSLADFAFELMRFGSDADLGWTCRDMRLCNRAPAMATQDRAIQLPDSNRTQVYMLWIE